MKEFNNAKTVSEDDEGYEQEEEEPIGIEKAIEVKKKSIQKCENKLIIYLIINLKFN